MKKLFLISILLLICSVSFAQLSYPVNLESCVGYWTLNSSDLYATDVFQDMSGNGNNGTSANTPVYGDDQNGIGNQSMLFNGSSDYVTVTGNSDLRPELITISYWLNANDISDPHCIIMNEDTYSTKTGYTSFVQSNFVRLDLGDGTNFHRTRYSITDYVNTWLHIVFTYDGTTQLMYINGVKVDDDSWSGVIDYNADKNVDFGIVNNHGSYKFDGSLSDILIYTTALTAEEVYKLHLAGQNTARMKVDARNLVTNGGFDADTDWTKGTGVTISGGKANINYSGVYQNFLRQDDIMTTGKEYRVVVDCTDYTSGTLTVWTGATSIDITGTGKYSKTFTATGATVYLSGTDFVGSVDNYEIVDITSKRTNDLQRGLILDMPLCSPYTAQNDSIVKDCTPYSNDGTVSGATVTSDSCYFTTDDYIDVGNVNKTLKTLSFWIYPEDVSTVSVIDLDGGTHTITIDGSGDITAGGFSSPSYYVNGSSGQALTINTWQHVLITTATGFTVSDLDYGRIAASYFEGSLCFARGWNRELSTAEIEQERQRNLRKFQ